MEGLPTEDREAVTHIWSLFSAAPADQRILILKGLLSMCCMPQLSFMYEAIQPLLRIDFISIFPRELSMYIFSFLDAKSLCHAAQVSRAWKEIADDDMLWHRMCEQHIDKKCTKCGWGLPLMNKFKNNRTTKKRSLPSSIIGQPCTPSPSPSPSETPNKKPKSSLPPCPESLPPGFLLAKSPEEPAPKRRPWKEVYSERLIVERNWRKNNYTVRVLKGHSDGVLCVQFCDVLNVIMTGSYDRTVRVWHLETGEEIRCMTGHHRCVRALQFDEAKLITGSMDGTLKVWNWHTGECIRTLQGHTGGVVCLHFNSHMLVSGSTDHTIRVWNFRAGECCTLTGHTEWVNSVRITDDGLTLVSGSDDTTVRLWDLSSGVCVKILRGHVGQVQAALPSPKGLMHRLSVFQNQVRRTQLTPPSNIFSPGCATDDRPRQPLTETVAASSPSNTPIIVSGSLDNTIKVWNMETGECLRTLFGHVEGVWTIAYDNLRIVSGSHDTSIRVWDMESGRCMYALEGHNGPVTALALGDTKIVSVSDDGDVRVWNYGLQSP